MPQDAGTNERGPSQLPGLDGTQLFDAFPNPMLLIDTKGTVLAANPEAAILIGRPADHLRHKRLKDLLRLTSEATDDPIGAAWRHDRPVKDIPAVLHLDDAQQHVVFAASKITVDGRRALLVVLRNASREQAVIRSIRAVAKRAARTADGLATMGEGTSRKVDEIRNSMREIADGTQVQADKVEETVDIIKGLARSIDAINTHATEAAQRSVAVAGNAREGTAVARRALERLSAIIEGVESSGHLVAELSEHIGEVETIIDFIREISQKTNMLALNAAIEAARAGEHGKAFGVVAEEVKRLSEHTRDSIRDVDTIIHEIKQDSNEVITAIQTRSEEVKDSSEVVRSALKRFETVAADIMESSQVVESISHRTTEQKRGAGAIVAAIDEVAAVAEEASGSTERTSHLANEMAESVEALTAATHELTAIATNLHGTLDQYFQQPSDPDRTWGDARYTIDDPDDDEPATPPRTALDGADDADGAPATGAHRKDVDTVYARQKKTKHDPASRGGRIG